MSRGAAYGFIPILVVGLVFGAYLSVVLSPSSIGPSTTPCGTHFNYGSSNPISVLEIESGSTGEICVEYTNSLNNSVSLPSYITVYQYNSSGAYGVCPSCVFNVVTSSFQVNASPNSVIFVPSANPNSETEVVTYTISVPLNVTSGIYGIFLLQFCSLFPTVVVPSYGSHTQLSRSDFSSWYPHSGSCPAQVMNSQVLGVSGFKVVSV